ncbi:MAG: proline--tRNA ligase [Minisyncoccota bacterium]
MYQTSLFTRTKKEDPKDEVSKNAQLLMRAGFVSKEMAGVYAFLPLGLRVLNNIIRIIRQEMDQIGGQEVSLTALQDKTLWEKTNRWDDSQADVWFKTVLKNDTEVGLGWSHEEPMTRLVSQHITSYRDLPVLLYQFQTKFRNETRAKSGIMRTREFIMKDLYSFARTSEEHERVYASVRQAYIRIFTRLGIGTMTYPAFASGGAFSQYSEEFQTISSAGEDNIYVDQVTGKALNEEVLNEEVLADLGIRRENLVAHKSIEVGNIFNLGTRFSESLGATFKDEVGMTHATLMGCYGIGPARAMGTIAEVLSDGKGLVWPEEVAPFRVHLLSLDANEKAEEIYHALHDVGIEVLYDDRNIRAGEKFAESDLFGIPYRIVLGKRGVMAGTAEVKKRTSDTVTDIPLDQLVTFLQK